MAGGKICAEDGLVAEMLRHLDIDILHLIADAFRLRILNHSSERGERAWEYVFLNLIPKILQSKTIKDFRPIAILPVLSKLFSKLMDYLSAGALGRTKAVQFAFKGGHQCHEPVFIMRRLIEVSIEWDIPIFILDGDIYKAYDNTRHGNVLQALIRRSVPRILAAAIIREEARAKGYVRIGNLESDTSLRRSRALWQGDPLAPHLFNIALDDVASEFEKTARRRKWGWPMQGPNGIIHLCLLLFADNYWILATSIQELQAANDHWQDLLNRAGWRTPVEELCYATTADDELFGDQVLYSGGLAVQRRPRAEGFKALGTQITFTCRDDRELERRIKAAWGAFHKYSDILCCRAAPIVGRLSFMHKVITPALFWCSGSWNLRSDQYAKLRGVQRSMIRKMLRFTKPDEEGIQDFMQRTNTTITNIMSIHRVVSWDIYARRTVFKWAGWLARLQFFDPERITLKVLLHRNLDWLQRIKDHNRGRELHCRYIKVWRWETLIWNFCRENFEGSMWQQLAEDPDSWNSIVSRIQ